MALSAAAVPCAGSAAAFSSSGRRYSASFAALSLPQRRRASPFQVRCQAEEKSQKQTTPIAPPPAVSTPPPPPPAPKVSTRFSDVLAFSGPGPERINGRLAMVGFVAALGVELASGDGLAAQLAAGNGVAWFAATAAALSVASLVPLFKGVTAESRSGRVMTSEAELWNGRFAMLGLVALAFTEFVKGGPLV